MPAKRAIDHPLLDCFGRLVEAYVHLERPLARALEEECGLPHVWFEVLLRLARSPEQHLTMGELARDVALTSGGVTRLVDRMEAADLVARRACPTDRRVQHAQLTPKGRAKLDQAIPVHLANLERLLGARLSRSELATLDRLLDRLRTDA